jgi:hypothetical protein
MNIYILKIPVFIAFILVFKWHDICFDKFDSPLWPFGIFKPF